MELGWRHANDLQVSEADYLEMVLKKTCWLATIYPLRAGALIGSRGTANLEPLSGSDFFSALLPDPGRSPEPDRRTGRYGKEIDGDLWEGKRTLMLIRALQLPARPIANACLRFSARLASSAPWTRLKWMRALVEQHECIEYARRMANELAGAALHEYSLLSAGLPDSRDKTFLEKNGDLGNRAQLEEVVMARILYNTTLVPWSCYPTSCQQTYTGVISQVFPLAAICVLEDFCDSYLNLKQDKNPPFWFKPAAPFVLMQVVDYGDMAEANAIGWFSQHELAFGIPVEWHVRDKDGWHFKDIAMHYPFIYVDNPLSIAGGREVMDGPRVRSNSRLSWSTSIRPTDAPA